jgi:hypothetical protein
MRGANKPPGGSCRGCPVGIGAGVAIYSKAGIISNLEMYAARRRAGLF